jgi:sterol desaturase/sphingolipid hydroxylase (fatty acid hydroxylase superfamily)
MPDPLLVTLGAIFLVFAVADLVHGERTFPQIPFWRARGLLAAAVYFAISYNAPFLWDAWLGAYALMTIGDWALWQQAAIGFLLLEFGTYAWHRTMHNVPFLWRHLHQMHHSAERVDIWGALYFHPFDTLGFALVGSLALVWALGVATEAAIIATIAASFCSMFQHANIRTPQWLGYFITRPESHSVHHQRDVHGYNYGDIPIFDMLFGTFRNPKTWDGEAGFYDGASANFWPLLVGRDISSGMAGEPSTRARLEH